MVRGGLEAMEPVFGISPQVHDCSHNDFFRRDAVENGERKAVNEPPANVASHDGACARISGDTINGLS